MSISQFRGEYAFLSNFYERPLIYEGIRYPTAEHAYQAAKTPSDTWEWRIGNAKTAGLAKRLGRQCPIHPDWEDRKIDVMRAVLKAKFEDPQLLAKLEATAPQVLVEGNTWGDRFWGQCPVGTGENWLGRLLMEIRDAPR